MDEVYSYGQHWRGLKICKEEPWAVFVCGMGQIESGGAPCQEDKGELAKYLMETEVWIFKCKWEWSSVDEEKNICGRGVREESTGCCGDSGSALFGVDREGNATCLYGVVSGTDTGCKVGTVFTRADVLQRYVSDHDYEYVYEYDYDYEEP